MSIENGHLVVDHAECVVVAEVITHVGNESKVTPLVFQHAGGYKCTQITSQRPPILRKIAYLEPKTGLLRHISGTWQHKRCDFTRKIPISDTQTLTAHVKHPWTCVECELEFPDEPALMAHLDTNGQYLGDDDDE